MLKSNNLLIDVLWERRNESWDQFKEEAQNVFEENLSVWNIKI